MQNPKAIALFQVTINFLSQINTSNFVTLVSSIALSSYKGFEQCLLLILILIRLQEMNLHVVTTQFYR